MFGLNSSENWHLVLYLQVRFFYLIDVHFHLFPKPSLTCWILSRTNTTLWECGMSHSCSQSVCSLVCTLAIHSPHHPPIPLTIMYSCPSNRSDWRVFHFYRFCRGKAEKLLIWINCFVTSDYVFRLFASQMCRGIFQSIWPLRPVFFWPGNFQRAATPTALLYVHRLVHVHL